MERYNLTSQSIQIENSMLTPYSKKQENSQIYLSQGKLSMLLNEAMKKASIPNWDDEDGSPVNEKCIHFMRTLISVYPPGLLLPEIYPDPDGSIGMEWEFEDGTNLSANMMPSGSIAYAILGESQEGFGKILWNQESFPKELESLIRVNERH